MKRFCLKFHKSPDTAVVAQKTNGVNNLPPVPMPPRSVPVVETVTEDDVARGWRVESVATNEPVSYTMPSNAVYVGNWHVHGARSSFGKNVIDFGSAGTPRPTSLGLWGQTPWQPNRLNER